MVSNPTSRPVSSPVSNPARVGATPLAILGDRLKWWGDSDNVVIGVDPDVQSQTDRTKFNRDIAQVVDTKRPHTSTVLGPSSLLYNAAAVQMLDVTGESFYPGGDFAAFWVVAKCDTIAAEQTIFTFGTGTQFRVYFRIVSSDFRAQMATTGGLQTMQSTDAADTLMHLFFVWADATTCYLDIDGTEFTIATTDGTMLAAGTAIQASGRGASEPLDGHLVEQACFSGPAPPTLAERQAMRAYFEVKYAGLLP